ncbi:MAG TPA: DUF5132 domain-containing protein [Myxococcota bacterium]|nr:DUF5132 domain-containing protein [Myxococcota bacterium]
MGFLQENRGFVLGFSMGLGAGLIAREMFPSVAKMIKPTAKMLVLNGLTLVEKIKENVARAQEALSDLTAEVDLELKAKKAKSTSGPPRPRKTPSKNIASR